ncbi:hypothetical protein PGB90_008393 [Kerria lacca]
MTGKKPGKVLFIVEEDEKLVEMVAKHPCIFDISNSVYKDQSAKDSECIQRSSRLYSQIRTKSSAQYEDLSSAEEDTLANESVIANEEDWSESPQNKSRASSEQKEISFSKQTRKTQKHNENIFELIETRRVERE